MLRERRGGGRRKSSRSRGGQLIHGWELKLMDEGASRCTGRLARES